MQGFCCGFGRRHEQGHYFVLLPIFCLCLSFEEVKLDSVINFWLLTVMNRNCYCKMLLQKLVWQKLSLQKNVFAETVISENVIVETCIAENGLCHCQSVRWD